MGSFCETQEGPFPPISPEDGTLLALRFAPRCGFVHAQVCRDPSARPNRDRRLGMVVLLDL